jgi:hypothetical protein
VVFVMNPTAGEVTARVSIAGVDALTDLLDGRRIARAGGAIEVTVPARLVRILAVDG